MFVRFYFLDDLHIQKKIYTSTCYCKEVQEIYINAYRFQVVTGLRPGEVFGLKWSDIKKRVLHLSRSINCLDEVTSGKNENAQRNIYLTDIAIATLSSQKQLLKLVQRWF